MQTLKKAAVYTMVFAFGTMLFTGCAKKEEPKPVEEKKTEQVTPDTLAQAKTDTTSIQKQTETTPQEKEVKEINMVGTWSGSMDSRTCILRISSQNGNNFSGTITIKTREEVVQNVSGKVDPSSLKVRFKDQLHSREMGTYSAKLSADMTKMSGSFTKNLDKVTVSFSLRKK